MRVREVAELINGHPFDSLDFSDVGELPLVRIRDLMYTSYGTWVDEEVTPKSAIIQNGDVVIGMDGDFNCLLWARGRAALNQRLCLLRTTSRSDPRFLAYALPDHLRRINDLTYATTVKHLSSTQIRSIRLPIPTLAEQKAIADYLDREIAQIDPLIGKQKRLIETLRERRGALISRAILGYNATNEPSRVEMVPLRHLSSLPITNGLGLPGNYANRDWPRYVRTTDIADATSLRSDVFASQPPDVASAALLSRGDLLMTAAGSSVGKSVLFNEFGAACYAGFLVRVRPRDEVQGRFLSYWCQSRHYWDQIELGAVQSTIKNFSASRYRAMRVPQPPLERQQAIVEGLDAQTARSDALIAKAEHFIALARERRAALITAAVTGQIDVRTAA